MAKQTQLRRGTTAEHSSFTGAVGEVTVDTSKDTAVVHDGSTVGGHALALEKNVPNGANSAITDNGTNVGIGTSSPSAKLDVYDYVGGISQNIELTNGAATISGRGCDLNINSATTNIAKIRGITTGDATTGDLIAYTSSGGVSSEKLRILSSGGITFNGDTSTANALDDYEEGTFAPTLIGTTSGVATATVNLAKYTKIGDTVHAYIYLAGIDPSPCVGEMRVAGLPFSATTFAQNTSVSYTNLFTYDEVDKSIGGFVAASELRLYRGMSISNVTSSVLTTTAGGLLMVGITYKTS